MTTDPEPWRDAPTEPYPPGLYDYTGLAAGVETWAEITPREIEAFHRDGYLVIRRAFAPEEVRAGLDGLADLIAGKNPAFKGIQFEAGARELRESLPPERTQDAVRKFWRFVEYETRLKALSEHPELLSVLERIMEDRPELFQDMALLKPPGIGREKPWHQDCAYFNLPTGTTVVGAWIALDAATPENGCMRLLPGAHAAGPRLHFNRRDWQLCDAHVPRHAALAAPLAPGGCLLFHGLLPHGTPANRTGQRRRAVQFHYKPAAVEWSTLAERMERFGSEGKDVEC